MNILPRRYNEFNLLEEMMRIPFFSESESRIMKTNIREKEDKYLIDVDLPGYDKQDIKLEIKDGYLTINAKSEDIKEEKENGSFVRRERFMGSCSRSFYIGDKVEPEDVKATFKNGILSIEVYKKEVKKDLNEGKFIEIES